MDMNTPRSELGTVEGSCIVLSQRCWILYTNWKGSTRWRHIHPVHLRYERTEWHDPTWILLSIDLEITEERSFALKDITRVMTDEEYDKSITKSMKEPRK